LENLREQLSSNVLTSISNVCDNIAHDLTHDEKEPCADCPPDTISPIGEKLGACAKPCLQEMFRPQNRGALAQAAPATSRAQENPSPITASFQRRTYWGVKSPSHPYTRPLYRPSAPAPAGDKGARDCHARK
jgi:hypothetical protein